MKITISDPVSLSLVPPNSYFVEITLMSGDGDGYTKMISPSFSRNKDELKLENLLETLNRIDKRYPRGMSGSDNYDDVLGFAQWFGEGFDFTQMREAYSKALNMHPHDEIELAMELSKDHGMEWRSDPMGDYTTPQSLSEFEVFYFDEKIVKHHVIVEF